MNVPTQFLIAVGQALSAMNLYREAHPARDRALDVAYRRTVDLQEERLDARFTFLGDEVIYGKEPLWDLRGWEWAERFSRTGVQRIELTGVVTREDLEGFLEELLGWITGERASSAQARHSRPTAIRWGAVLVRDDLRTGAGLEGGGPSVPLHEEAEAIQWVHEELQGKGSLHLLEAESIVRSLSLAMRSDQRFLIPLIDLKEYDQYTTTHSINVAVLAMGLAEFIGMNSREVWSFGVAGLLHDLGKTRIPADILNKPGALTPQERKVMDSHTVEGARIILESDQHLDLASVVAYEHHIRVDGGGYPELRFRRKCHACSKLVHVCDVYDALRTRRPYRDSWPHDRILRYIEAGAGTEFDRDMARSFCQMMEVWEPRQAHYGPGSTNGPDNGNGEEPLPPLPGSRVSREDQGGG